MNSPLINKDEALDNFLDEIISDIRTDFDYNQDGDKVAELGNNYFKQQIIDLINREVAKAIQFEQKTLLEWAIDMGGDLNILEHTLAELNSRSSDG